MEVRTGPVAVRGFRFAGVSAGLKTSAGVRDLGLIVADTDAATAGVFTTNRVKAAPVVIAEQRVGRGRLRAIAANSGSANCFTGRAGLQLARASSAAVARELGCAPQAVAPCSTGVIGHLFDLEKYQRGAREAAAALSSDGLEDFARAIMTTDTRPKLASVAMRLGGADLTIAGVAKGAGMIQPHMATMLAFIVTDAAVSPVVLRSILKRVLPVSFNAITVDGDMSTNDTLIMMASGAARNRRFAPRELASFEAGVREVARSLARQLVYDGEGATKLVPIEVRGARTSAEAFRVARQIANSPLVKTAFFGCDPNVGRIIAAAGACGVAINPARLALQVAGVPIAARGALLVDALGEAQARMREREFRVVLDLKQGRAQAVVLTSDLSFDYVKINAEYTT
ncbi:MAG TPA: bifunctional glutamate N-acetyltransferase/amino-acid acetyltransferase ArgJ [Candidatus Binataceae bacterium]|nr:bifunctional glutamate N-acetyltransferase/amino-acid acetyltransferase ArgJ [Candidatus Binataceae bacterium]